MGFIGIIAHVLHNRMKELMGEEAVYLFFPIPRKDGSDE